MKIITAPRVELIASSVFNGHSEYEIPSDGDDATRIGAFAAKGCYDSFGATGRSNKKNQLQIIEMRHGSVLEHASATLFIEGITRALSLEMNRHRHFAISQRSTRYTAEEDAAIVLDPYYAELWRRRSDEPSTMSIAERELIIGHVHAAELAVERYKMEVGILEDLNPLDLKSTELRKWARGKARNILPHALETRVTYTANLRTWRHFIEMRSERSAEAEIRRLAAAVADRLIEWAPLYFADYEVKIIGGLPEFKTQFRKV